MENYNERDYLDSITNRAVTLSKTFSKNFKIENVDRLAVKGRLKSQDIAFIKEVWNILEELYPGNGDIHFELEPKYKTYTNSYGSNHVKNFKLFDKFDISYIYLVIRFPEIEITNSKKHTLLLRDLYTRIPVKLGNARVRYTFQQIQGTRITLSMLEYTHNYGHSHLSIIDYKLPQNRGHFLNFCTGEGDINHSRGLLNCISDSFDYDMLRLHLLQVDPFLKWESIAGIPYFRMNNLITKDYVYPNIDIAMLENYYRKVIQSLRRDTTLNWKFTGGKYCIIDNEKFENIFRIPELVSHMVNRDESDNYYQETPSSITDVGVQPEWIPFRNEKIHFKVEGTIKKSGPQDLKYINPKIKFYVKSRLEYKANKKILTSSGISRSNTSGNS